MGVGGRVGAECACFFLVQELRPPSSQTPPPPPARTCSQSDVTTVPAMAGKAGRMEVAAAAAAAPASRARRVVADRSAGSASLFDDDNARAASVVLRAGRATAVCVFNRSGDEGERGGCVLSMLAGLGRERANERRGRTTWPRARRCERRCRASSCLLASSGRPLRPTHSHSAPPCTLQSVWPRARLKGGCRRRQDHPAAPPLERVVRDRLVAAPFSLLACFPNQNLPARHRAPTAVPLRSEGRLICIVCVRVWVMCEESGWDALASTLKQE